MSTLTSHSFAEQEYSPSSTALPRNTGLPIDQTDYNRLRQIASAILRRERPGHALQSEDLLHEVIVRWMRSPHYFQFRDWDHLRRTAVSTMHRALIDHNRSARATKRGGKSTCIALEPHFAIVGNKMPEGMIVSQALQRLSSANRRKCRVVELRVFSALSLAEIAKELTLSTRTVRRDWEEACVFLRKELKASPPVWRKNP